ncbi:uncharacterized protein IL334_000974 [Kwoniella shivajii]|uniref:Zn(2)-C6 fungal-type domain-containing protein n=1 Tax=Kwoniella shivajii TaxID=564305 RepID=A0ABZ1CQN4_9TREE|nr:hypothetical protein IL334_000974 [Kwoniella shivajii]
MNTYNNNNNYNQPQVHQTYINEPGPSSDRLHPGSTAGVGHMSRISSEGGYDSSDVESSLIPGKIGGKRKKNINEQIKNEGHSDERIKKTRQSPCRARKVKCDRPPPGSSSSLGTRKVICSHCEHLGLACTFEYKPKKRGPPNMYMRKLKDEDDKGSSSTDESPDRSRQTHPLPSVHVPSIQLGMPDPSYPALAKNENPSAAARGWEPTLASAQAQAQAQVQMQAHPSSSTSFSNLNENQNQTQTQGQFLSSIHSYPHYPQPSYVPINSTSTPSSPSSIPRQFGGQQSQNHGSGSLPPYHVPGSSSYTSPAHNIQPLAYPTPTNSSPRYLSKPVYMYVEHPYNPLNPLEQVLPRQTIYQIIDLFFDYIYCLIPCLHRPTFTHDLNIKREERSGEDEWAALVLAIIGSTLAQLPRSFVQMSRKEVKSLILACHKKVREYLAKDFQTVTINRIIILYHILFVSRILGQVSRMPGDIGSLCAYLIALKAHEEKTYARLGPVDRIFLRRCFWLMYGADVSIASTEATPLYFNEYDTQDVAFPEELDDEYISEDGYLPKPEGYVPILTGFNYVSQLHRITGQLLDKLRRDKKKPPTGLLLQMRLNEINELYERTMTLMDNCPKSLWLEYRNGSKSVESLSPGWNKKAKNDIMAIFSDANYDAEVIKDHYLVQQANIYVTQQQVRFMILQYRDELHDLQLGEERRTNIGITQYQLKQHQQQQEELVPRIRSRSGDETKGQEEILVTSSAEKDEVIIDLLAILQRIPMTVLAVNNLPIVAKVQFVASTLLDSIDSNDLASAMNPTILPTVVETRAQKAQRNLWQFLNILTEIQSLYSLEDD